MDIPACSSSTAVLSLEQLSTAACQASKDIAVVVEGDTPSPAAGHCTSWSWALQHAPARCSAELERSSAPPIAHLMILDMPACLSNTAVLSSEELSTAASQASKDIAENPVCACLESGKHMHAPQQVGVLERSNESPACGVNVDLDLPAALLVEPLCMEGHTASGSTWLERTYQLIVQPISLARRANALQSSQPLLTVD